MTNTLGKKHVKHKEIVRRELDQCKLGINKMSGSGYDPCGVPTSSHTHWLMVFDVPLIRTQVENLDPIQRVLGHRI